MTKIKEYREIRVRNNHIDEETLKNDGWAICEVRSIGKNTIVVMERDKHDAIKTYVGDECGEAV